MLKARIKPRNGQGCPATADRIIGGATERFGRVDTLINNAGGVLFLESSPYITGEIVHVDGGRIAGH